MKKITKSLFVMLVLLFTITLSDTQVEAAKKIKVEKITCTKVAHGVVDCKMNGYSNGMKTKYSKKMLTLYKGQKYGLGVKVKPANASNKKVTYTVKNPKIVKVSKKGRVTALKPGSTIITVKATDGSGKKTHVKVWVVSKREYVKVKSLKVAYYKTTKTKGSDTFWGETKLKNNTVNLAVGQKALPAITIKSKEGKYTLYDGMDSISDCSSNPALSYKSSNPKVASVDYTGVIKAKKTGTTTITVTTRDGSNKKISFKVSVYKAYKCSQCGKWCKDEVEAKSCADYDLNGIKSELVKENNHVCWLCDTYVGTYEAYDEHLIIVHGM